jgi:hypothetical protein
MTQSTALDKVESMARAIEFLVHFSDKDVWSPEDELAAVCAFAERFDADAIVGYTTIDSRSHVATFQTAVYPRLPTWPFSKLHDVPVTRPYAGTCAKAICERRTITCSDITTETSFDSTWRDACTEFGLRSVQSAPAFGFDGRPLGTFVTACGQSRHSFDHDDRVRRVCPTNHPSKALDEGSAGPDKDVPRRAIERHKGRSGN